MSDTISGTKASTMIYTLDETAKAKSLKPYEYFKYLLEEIPEHVDDNNTDFIKKASHMDTRTPKTDQKMRKPPDMQI